VFKSLQVPDLPKRPDGRHPTLGEVCGQWVFDLVAVLFGSEDPETGIRYIRDVFLLISKKNGKSLIAAGIMTTAQIINWRPSAELTILAPTKEVANNSFEPAAGMVRADPQLAVTLKVIDHERTIRHLDNDAELKVISADSGVVAGSKSGMVLREEIWLFGKSPKAPAMFRESIGGLSTRQEGFVLDISTHSDEPPSGVFKERLAYARDVRDGVIHDPSFLPILYEWPEEMLEAEAYLDPANFYVTNPHIGRSVSQEWLEREMVKAQAGESEESIQVFLAKHLNVEIGMRLRRDRWNGADYWTSAVFEPLRSLDELLGRSEVAVVGIDGGGLDDLTGLCVLGRDRKTGVWLYWFHSWVHCKVLASNLKHVPLLRGFIADGDLTVWGQPGGGRAVASVLADAESDKDWLRTTADEDVQGIVEVCLRVRDAGLLPADDGIGVDRAAIGSVLDGLRDAGFSLREANLVTGEVSSGVVTAVAQTAANMNSAILAMARKLEAGGAAHGGAPLMDWCVSNARAEQRGNAVHVTKQAAGTGKIDPLIAGFIATKLMELEPVAGDGQISVDEWIMAL